MHQKQNKINSKRPNLKQTNRHDSSQAPPPLLSID
jgi:hypothetical protein